MSKPTLAISVGDLNGVGMEIALKSHKEISKLCNPIYCINNNMLKQVTTLLNTKIPKNIQISNVNGNFKIKPSKISKKSGLYSYKSFLKGIELCEDKKADAVITMPIHKEAWMKCGIKYKGHTDLLRDYFQQDAIMMLGCQKMYVALFSEHIPLKQVVSTIKKQNLETFLYDFYKSIGYKKVAVLGLNPHAGDNGVLGDEEKIINKAIKNINKKIGKDMFIGTIVPDIAFTPSFRKNFNYFIAMYHDQGLAPLKALHFDESVNISLNLPIIRTSVDHGTAFDIAYKNKANTLSYINAVKSAISLINHRF